MRTRLGSQQRLNKSNATTTPAHKDLVPFSGNDAPVLWPMSSGASSCFYSWCEEQRKRQQGLAYCSHETHQLRTWVDLGHLKMLSAQQCAEAERMAPGPTKVRFDRFPVFSTYVLLLLHCAEEDAKGDKSEGKATEMSCRLIRFSTARAQERKWPGGKRRADGGRGGKQPDPESQRR